MSRYNNKKTDYIHIDYMDNNITFSGLSENEEASISDLWSCVRNDYLDWVASVRLKKFDDRRSIIKCFQWKGMSTWWMNPLVQKDSFVRDQWINRLMVLYLCNLYDNRIVLNTDDKIIVRAIQKNNVNLAGVELVKSIDMHMPSILIAVFRVVARLLRYLFVIFFVPRVNYDLIFKKGGRAPIVWFRTLYPVSWSNGNNDQIYGSSPSLGYGYGFEPIYLTYIQPAKLTNNYASFLRLLMSLIKLRDDFKPMHCFPEHALSVLDVLSVYLSSFIEQIKFFWISRKYNFRSLFNMNGMDVSDILLDKWGEGYWGFQQDAKLQAVSMAKFFSQLSDGQKIVTYGELFAFNRGAYFLTKRFKPNTKFIAVQHAMNAKNKMFTYHRAGEFSYDNISSGLLYSPYPDYFLVQGDQYKRILSEFYSPERIYVLGTLRKRQCIKSNNYDHKFKIDDVLLKKKLLLIAPSVGTEYKGLIDLFSLFRLPEDWALLFLSHPRDSSDKAIDYQRGNYPQLQIVYFSGVPAMDIISECSLVVTGFSTLSIEARLCNVPSVRYVPLGRFPQFDDDNRVPRFYSSSQFMSWFEVFSSLSVCGDVNADNEIIRDYYLNDSNSSNRLWEFIKSLS